MAILGEMGKFLEKGTEVLTDLRATLATAHEALTALRPALAELPALVRETRGLVSDARGLLVTVAPIVVQGARQAVALLEAARARREASPHGAAGPLRDVN